VNQFEKPAQSLAGLDLEAAAHVIAAATDVALVLDHQGVIRDVAGGSEDLAIEGYKNWVGQAWEQIVTAESRPKVAALLKEAGLHAGRKWRHVNHPSKRGADVPVLYSAIQVGKESHVIALGRDLRATAALQQRLVDAQQSMERDYLRLRHVETQYRVLFQNTAEPVLIVDGSSLKLLDANSAANVLFADSKKRILGRSLLELLAQDCHDAVQSMLAGAKVAIRADYISVKLSHQQRDISNQLRMSATAFRQENALRFLVRLLPDALNLNRDRAERRIVNLVEKSTDAFVATDAEGHLLSANAAFLDLAQLSSIDAARGELLERWVGRPGVDMGVLLGNLRQHGSVRMFSSVLRGEHGTVEDIEISAVSSIEPDLLVYGLFIRTVSRRLNSEFKIGKDLPRSIEQLTELVGRVSLKDLLRESTDLIEKLCIEAALQLTRDNRASAAELLGLSRQSLYVKLRRYGLGDLNGEAAAG
jgi:transcriptional regulator PpsR